MSFFDALNKAKDMGVDLVETVPNTDPIVCKLLDYKKFLFDENKKEKRTKKAQRVSTVEMKEVQLNSVIQDNDLEIKIKNILRLLSEKNKVKVVVKFVGRQIQHSDIGRRILEKITEATALSAVVERSAIPEFARNIFIILTPI